MQRVDEREREREKKKRDSLGLSLAGSDDTVCLQARQVKSIC